MSKKVSEFTGYDKPNDEENLYEFPGYPLYPKRNDVYDRNKVDTEIDPEDITQLKVENKKSRFGKNSEIDSVEELDVPGAELDDEEESVGSEDEENNYYSLGGDDHNNLEEDNGD